MAALKPVTLITGASAGIGTELAHVFAANGHDLALTARRAPQLQTLAETIAARGRPRPLVIPIDLSRPDAPAQIAADLRDAGMEPQFVVNNAGYGLVGDAADLDRAEQLGIVDLNVRALTDLSLRFIEAMARHRGGLMNVASLAAFMPGPGMAVYHATKAYVLSLTEALHHELKPQGIRVTALCPGPVETGFQARSHMPSGYFPQRLSRTAERVARDGYDGLMRGRRVIIPGSDNFVTALLPRLLPRGTVLKLVRRAKQP